MNQDFYDRVRLLTWADYQRRAEATSGNAGDTTPWRRLLAAACLAEEAAEISAVVRSGESSWGFDIGQYKSYLRKVREELGDSLWYTAEAASSYGLALGEIAEAVVEGVWSRKVGDLYSPGLIDGFYMLTGGRHGCDEVRDVTRSLVIEVGAYVGIVKKHVGHGHPLDEERLSQQLGRVLFVTVQVAYWYRANLAVIAQENLDKLAGRYPEGFSEEASINR